MQTTELLVIGAGPYGLCIAAHAKDSGLSVAVVGESMAFWKHNMPSGMLLRSGLDWHLDASEVHTLEAFLEERRIPRTAAKPMPVETFRDYAEWFRECKQINVQPLHVDRVHRVDGQFEAHCDNGETIRAATWWLRPVSRRSQMYPVSFRPVSLAIEWPTQPRSWISAAFRGNAA